MDTLEVEVATLEAAAVVATLEGTVAIQGAMAEATRAEVVTLEEAEVVTLEVAEAATLGAAEAATLEEMVATLEGMVATPEAVAATPEVEVVKATLATVVTNINREESSRPPATTLDRVSPPIETRKIRHPPAPTTHDPVTEEREETVPD